MLETFNATISQLPGLVFYKNTNLVYVAASNFIARMCGFENSEQLCGHNDFELSCAAADCALDYRAEDNKVLSTGKEISSLQINKFADGNIHIFLLRKAPVRDAQGQIIGVCGMGSEVTNPATGQAIFNLLTTAAKYVAGSLENQTFIIGNENLDHLSARESELIFYFMRGFSNKEIGVLMKLSPRTIESYLESIKNKYHCATRKELLLKCMHNGFTYIIPQTILQRCLNKTVSWDKVVAF
jgi:DNA-binding CsgD family transcriptional regulator